ncbi:MAG: ribosomal-processing cysteine protease Prp [Lachnospiraceae bacterium]|nr:ribosomal-processing cysteine protease Prp [Lachnospiraceae bacterium]
MISATVLKRNQQIYGFVISGHSGYENAGKDIVCAAVSVLAENTINAIEAFTDDTVDVLVVDHREGFLNYRLRTVSEKSALLLDTLVLGLNDISRSYSSFVKVSVEED